MRAGVGKAADVALTGANLAAPFIPGGAVLSAAVSGTEQLMTRGLSRQGAEDVLEDEVPSDPGDRARLRAAYARRQASMTEILGSRNQRSEAIYTRTLRSSKG
jgi:hypothetical protein